jgi:dTDP-glucose 4,6-dehydratase
VTPYQATILRADLDELLAVNPSPWEKLKGMRLFITGGTGLFGRWMLESLLWANDRLGLGVRVAALVRRPEAWRESASHLAGHPALTIHQGDLLTFKFPPEKFSHVIHLAAPSDGPSQTTDPLALFDILVEGTRRVLDWAARSGAERFLYVSSGAVYGRHVKEVREVDETCREAPDPLDPASCYDEGKRAAELLCALYWQQRQLPAVVARSFSVVGPFLPLDWHYAAGNFIRDALAGGPIRVTGDGSPERSYLYLADLAWWLWVILTEGRPGRAYNVGGDEAVSIGELARRTAACFSPALKVEIACQPRPGQTPQRQVPSVRRAWEELNLKPRLGLDEALRRMIAWYDTK